MCRSRPDSAFFKWVKFRPPLTVSKRFSGSYFIHHCGDQAGTLDFYRSGVLLENTSVVGSVQSLRPFDDRR
jgi:hypothetical protein